MRLSQLIGLTTGCLLLICSTSAILAEVKLPGVFSDHMVLQRDQELPIWGTAGAGEEVTVSIAGQQHTTQADEAGKWRLKLQPLKLGEPLELTVRGKNSLTIKDVLVGDVWVGSGQSNMAGGVNGYSKGDEVLAKLAEGTYPKLRLCRGNGGQWQAATPANSKNYSAILFAFGQKVQQELDVPVGLIVGAVGGTPSGRWLSDQMLQEDAAAQELIKELNAKQPFEKLLAEYEVALAKWRTEADAAKAAGKQPPRAPQKPVHIGEIRNGRIGDLYEANIEPIVPFGIKGVLWDQGESGTALEGLDQFTVMGALIKGWRKSWGQGEFPFLYVQKPSGGGCAWDPSNPVTSKAEAFAKLPAAPLQGNEAANIELHIRIMQHPNTAMVTAKDLGFGIHPTNKSGYGQRAAQVALGLVYGKEVAIYGPLYASHAVEGNKIRVKFSHVGQGLAWKHGEGLQGFQIAGQDGKFVWAEGTIEGDSVLVSSDTVAEPTAVRYAWAENSPWANLFNKDGLPAVAFRTDQK